MRIELDGRAVSIAALVFAPLFLPVATACDTVVMFDAFVIWLFCARSVRPCGYVWVAAFGYACIMLEETHAGHWSRVLAENCLPLAAARFM